MMFSQARMFSPKWRNVWRKRRQILFVENIPDYGKENFFRQSLLKHFQIIQERVRRFGSMLFSPVEICPMYGEKCTEFLS